MVRRVALLLVLATLCFAGGGSVVAADLRSNSCSIVGTWHGEVDLGHTWMGLHTPGSNATIGQLTLEWIVVDPTLAGNFKTAVRASLAHGVWQKVTRRVHRYTWIGYGFDAAGVQLYALRTSGTGSMVDCDHLHLDYVLEIFAPGQDMSKDPPLYGTLSGTGSETRMELVRVN